MTTNSNILKRNTFRDLRAPGWFAERPLLGLILFLSGILVFGFLAYGIQPNGPLVLWDIRTAKAWRADTLNLPGSLVEYILFGFFLGKEMVILIGMILGLYFLYKRYWRELAMLLFGLGGGAMIWYAFSQFFDRPRPETPFHVLVLRDPSFPGGVALSAVLCYGFLAYLLVPVLPSRFWKWLVAILLTLVIAFVGLSTILYGAHYLTDVIAGYALGLAWAGLVYTLTERSFPEGAVRVQEISSKRAPVEGLRVPGWFKRWPTLGLLMILLGGLIFAGLSYNLVAHGPLLQVDDSVHKELLAQAKTAPPIVNEIMLFGFFIGKEVVQLIVMGLTLYFLHKRYWRELAMLWTSSAFGSFVWNFVIAYFNRPRPPDQTGLVITNLPSFPSGHAMSALICYGFLAYLLIPRMPSRFWKWIVAIVALVIVIFDGFSRVFQGGHYLTDVVAGYAMGIAWAGLVYIVIEGVFMKKEEVQNVEKK